MNKKELLEFLQENLTIDIGVNKLSKYACDEWVLRISLKIQHDEDTVEIASDYIDKADLESILDI